MEGSGDRHGGGSCVVGGSEVIKDLKLKFI